MINPFRILANVLILIVFLCVTYTTIFAKDDSQSRQRLLMDFNWKFQLGDQDDAEKASYDDSDWRELNLPHDWSIEGEYSKDEPTGGSGGYLPTGIGWYRRHFQMSKDDLVKNIWIEFECLPT